MAIYSIYIEWTLLPQFFGSNRVSGKFLLLPCFIEIPVFNANGVDSDSVVPALGLHYLSGYPD